MKRILLTTAVCSAILTLVSCKPSKEDIKKGFINKCSTSLPASFPKDVAMEYCNCSADALLNKYSVEEITEMEKKIAAGDEQVKNKMLQDVMPCAQALAAKAQNK